MGLYLMLLPSAGCFSFKKLKKKQKNTMLPLLVLLFSLTICCFPLLCYLLNSVYSMLLQSVEQLALHVARLYFLLKKKNKQKSKAYANKKNL